MKKNISSRIFFFFCGLGSGCPATIFCKVSDFSEPIEPYWESNRTCQPHPGRGLKHPIPRVGKGVPGFGIKRAPSREGVIARWTIRPAHRRPQFPHYFDSRNRRKWESKISLCTFIPSGCVDFHRQHKALRGNWTPRSFLINSCAVAPPLVGHAGHMSSKTQNMQYLCCCPRLIITLKKGKISSGFFIGI